MSPMAPQLLRSRAFAFSAIVIFTFLYSKSTFLQMTTNFEIILDFDSSKHFDFNFAHHFVIY